MIRRKDAPSPFSKVFPLLLCGIMMMNSGCGDDPDESPPSQAPSSPAASAGDGYNYLAWAGVSGATSYNYYWSVVPGVTKSTGFKVNVSATSTVHGGLTNGTRIYYIVAAQNSFGEGPSSSEFNSVPVNGSASSDPYYTLQWNLKNTGQAGALGHTGAAAGLIGEDVNVEPAWNLCPAGQATCRGEGVRVAVVDSDLEIAHEDLIANVVPGKSHDYVQGDTNPSGSDPDYFHGTAVASIISARDLNAKGLRGVAPRTQLIGRNFLADPTYTNLIHALSADASEIAVSNNSWGEPDGTGLLSDTPSVFRNAIETGLATGRGGKGTIYVWSAGNGGGGASCGASGPCVDNSNYDGYANYRGVIAVGALNASGKPSSYTEEGANVLVSAPGGEYCSPGSYAGPALAVIAADPPGSLRGLNPNPYYDGDDFTTTFDYTKCMNGTSAAAPHVSGVAALILQANPALTWREVRWILASTARANDVADPVGWVTNQAGLKHHHHYGFGRVRAKEAVDLAKTFTNFPTTQLTHAPASRSPASAIPDDNTTGVSDSISVSGSGITDIEFMEVTFRATHNYSGDLELTLTHTDTGTSALLSKQHLCEDSACDTYDNWVFGNVRHLGESADGTWTLQVKDLDATVTGVFESWSIKFYGK